MNMTEWQDKLDSLYPKGLFIWEKANPDHIHRVGRILVRADEAGQGCVATFVGLGEGGHAPIFRLKDITENDNGTQTLDATWLSNESATYVARPNTNDQLWAKLNEFQQILEADPDSWQVEL